MRESPGLEPKRYDHAKEADCFNVGGGFVPGLNAVLTGMVIAAEELGREVVNLRDRFECTGRARDIRQQFRIEVAPLE